MPSHQGNIVLTGYLAKQLSIIFIESYNTIGCVFFSHLRAFVIGYLGRREHFTAITITQINSKAYAEPITGLFSVFTL